MKNVTHPTQGLASHAAVLPLTPQRQQTLVTIALDLRSQHGERYAKQWLAQQLRHTTQATPNVTHHTSAPDEIDKSFESTQAWSTKQVEAMSDQLEKGPLALYSFLHHYAASDAHLLGYKLTAFQHEFFCIAEVFAFCMGISRSTFYRHLGVLNVAGLVHARGHHTTVSTFGTRCDGTVFAVKFNPRRSGSARCTHAYLASQAYRHLEADIAEKRTFWALRQSRNGVLKTLTSLTGILRWMNPKCTSVRGDQLKPRYLTVSCQTRSGLDAVLAVTKGRQQRGQRIAAAVKATTTALGDHHSVPFWWRFFDSMVRHAEDGGKDYAAFVHLALERERAAKEEGFARNAAALCVARLKASGVYAALMT